MVTDTLARLQRRLLNAAQYDQEEKQRGELQRCLEAIVRRQLEVSAKYDATSASNDVLERSVQDVEPELQCVLERLRHLSTGAKTAIVVDVIERRLLKCDSSAQVQRMVRHSDGEEMRRRQSIPTLLCAPLAMSAGGVCSRPVLTCRILWPLYHRCRVAVTLMNALAAHSTGTASARLGIEVAMQDVMGAMLLTLLHDDAHITGLLPLSSEPCALTTTSVSAMQARFAVQLIVWWLLSVQSYCSRSYDCAEGNDHHRNQREKDKWADQDLTDTAQCHFCDVQTQIEARWCWLLQTGRLCLYTTLQRDLVQSKATALTMHMRDLLYATTPAVCAEARHNADVVLSDILLWCDAELAVPVSALSMTAPPPTSSSPRSRTGSRVGDTTATNRSQESSLPITSEEQTPGGAANSSQTLGSVVLRRVLHQVLRSLAEMALEQADTILTEAYTRHGDRPGGKADDATGQDEMSNDADSFMCGRLRTILSLLEGRVDSNVLGGEPSYLTLKRLVN